MNYQVHYERLIEKARSRTKPQEYCERHHILPRWQGGGDTTTNLVWLTGREHFVAHCLLAKWQGGKQWLAVHRMAKGLYRQKSKMYTCSRIEHAKLMKYVGYKNAISMMFAGKGVTARSKEKMSEDGRKGNKEGKRKSGILARDNKLGIHAADNRQRSEWAKTGKGGMRNYEKNKNSQASIFTFESRSSAGKLGIKVTLSQRYKCSECGLVSNPGGLGRHQALSKHVGRERVS